MGRRTLRLLGSPEFRLKANCPLIPGKLHFAFYTLHISNVTLMLPLVYYKIVYNLSFSCRGDALGDLSLGVRDTAWGPLLVSGPLGFPIICLPSFMGLAGFQFFRCY